MENVSLVTVDYVAALIEYLMAYASVKEVLIDPAQRELISDLRVRNLPVGPTEKGKDSK